MSSDRLEPRFVELIPRTLEPGILYISTKYRTASHLCPCGCGNKVVTPLKPGGWRMISDRGGVTLHPSVGSWSLPCRSHYVIRRNQVVWAGPMTDEAIAAGRALDQREREHYFNAPPPSWWWRLIAWLRRVLFRA